MHLDNRRLSASHTLDFHTAVIRYGQVGATNLPAAQRAISQSIVGEFVMKRSPHAVPLADEAREAILTAHAKGAVPAKDLQREAEAIFKSLTEHDLPGFTQTSAFQELLASLGAYATELVAAGASCTAEDLVTFERTAVEARAALDGPGPPVGFPPPRAV